MTIWLTVDETTPDCASAHDQVTVTFELFQPDPFEAGVRLINVMVGFDVSVTVATLVHPALSTAVWQELILEPMNIEELKTSMPNR